MEGIIRFDGAKWKDVGGGIPSAGTFGVQVYDLLVWKGDLYAGGYFQEVDGAPGNGIARWDGGKWSRLGDGVWQSGYTPYVQKMAVFNDELYVVGAFSRAGGVSADGIAKWDGKKWCGANDKFEAGLPPSDIANFRGELYIGGSSPTINGDTAFNYLAKWSGGIFGDSCSVPLVVPKLSKLTTEPAVYPIPATTRLFISVDGVETLTVCDLQGRLMLKTIIYSAKAGIDVSALCPGMYILSIVDNNGCHTIKFIKE